MRSLLLIFLFLGIFSSNGLKIEEICQIDDATCELECSGSDMALDLSEWKPTPHPEILDLQIYGIRFRGMIKLADFQSIFPQLVSLDLRGSEFSGGFDCGDFSTLSILIDCASSQDSNLKNAPDYGRSVCSCFGMEFTRSGQCSVSFLLFTYS